MNGLMSVRSLPLAALAGVTLIILTGCPGPVKPTPTETGDGVQVNRAKLSPEDRQLVDAQEFCVSSDDSRLGSMGPPVKVMIKGQPVFLCCAHCKDDAEADPDKTLAKLDELKAKAKAAKPAPK